MEKTVNGIFGNPVDYEILKRQTGNDAALKVLAVVQICTLAVLLEVPISPYD